VQAAHQMTRHCIFNHSSDTLGQRTATHRKAQLLAEHSQLLASFLDVICKGLLAATNLLYMS